MRPNSNPPPGSIPGGILLQSMLKPLDQADSQSAEFARQLARTRSCSPREWFGLAGKMEAALRQPTLQNEDTRAEYRRLARVYRERAVQGAVLDSLPPAIREAPLSYAAPRLGGMIELAARLAELDLSDEARVVRAEKYGFRANEINASLKFRDGGAFFAHLYHSVERRAEIEAQLNKVCRQPEKYSLKTKIAMGLAIEPSRLYI